MRVNPAIRTRPRSIQFAHVALALARLNRARADLSISQGPSAIGTHSHARSISAGSASPENLSAKASRSDFVTGVWILSAS